MDLEADLHSCGQPLSESGVPNGPRYVVIKRECRACKHLDEHVKKAYQKGVPNHVILSVVTEAQANAIHESQRAAKG